MGIFKKMKVVYICLLVLLAVSAVVNAKSRRLGDRFDACKKKCLHAESFTKCEDICKSHWGGKRRLLTFNDAKNSGCYNKFGYQAKPVAKGRKGGHPDYGKIKAGDKAKIANCIDKLNKRRRLLTFNDAKNSGCYNKFGYNAKPAANGKKGGHPNYGKIKTGDKAKIADCIDKLNKRRRLLTFNDSKNSGCYNKFGYKAKPAANGKKGGHPNYGKIKTGDKAKIAECIDGLNKRRRLLTFNDAKNSGCYNKFGYKAQPAANGKKGGHPNYGKIKAGDKAKIAECIDGLNKSRRLGAKKLTKKDAKIACKKVCDYLEKGDASKLKKCKSNC